MSIIMRLILWFRALFTPRVKALPEPIVVPPPVPEPIVVPPPVPEPIVVPPPAPVDRQGSFIIPDIYPKDIGDNPPFHVLPGLTVQGKEVIGCYIKCSEGLGWGTTNEVWFRRNWRAMAKVRAERPAGTEFFRGVYHFLRFNVDGAKQADYCLDLIEQAGGWGDEDLMLWCDVEEGGQGTWAGGEKLENIESITKRKRLAAEITTCTTAFVARVKQRYPGMKVGIYGRGVFRDLGMTNTRFGADAVCNPAYTKVMPSMVNYGWPLKDVVEWQLCGDGLVVAAGFPSLLPGWGKTDYSVVLNGANPVKLSDVKNRCLAYSR